MTKEYYLAAVLDRVSQRIVLMASAEGGVEIEEVARTTPEAIRKVAAHPLLGLLDYQARALAFELGLTGTALKDFVKIARGLVATMRANDADLVEINPLALVKASGPDGAVERLVCLDAKITLDDSAIPRHPELEALRDLDEEDPADVEARQKQRQLGHEEPAPALLDDHELALPRGELGDVCDRGRLPTREAPPSVQPDVLLADPGRSRGRSGQSRSQRRGQPWSPDRAAIGLGRWPPRRRSSRSRGSG